MVLLLVRLLGEYFCLFSVDVVYEWERAARFLDVYGSVWELFVKKLGIAADVLESVWHISYVVGAVGQIKLSLSLINRLVTILFKNKNLNL